MNQSKEYEFDFAISFAGSQRHIAERLAKRLKEREPRCIVFCDSSYRSRLLGKRLDQEFGWTFGEGTRFFVPIVSKEYTQRDWPQLEWSIARRESRQRLHEFILPLRFDDSLLLGLSDNIGYLDLHEHSLEEVVSILLEKLEEHADITSREVATGTWIATFGLVIEELVESGSLPITAPRYYPHLCDWLEDDLMGRLELASILHPRMTEASARDGETLSVRIAFEWTPMETPLDFGELVWWDVLELVPYSDVYGEES